MNDTRLILFGACDRHNLGDLLFPHLATALLAPRPVIVAGLAERDLTPYGGHRVRSLHDLSSEWGDRPVALVHVGGELLTCTLYEAAVMTRAPDEVTAAIARYDSDPGARTAWAQAMFGLSQDPAYLVPRELFRNTTCLAYQGIGGMGLSQLPDAIRATALQRLREADWLTVRDHRSQALIAEAGIAAELVPDTAVLTDELFGDRIARHAAGGEPLQTHERFPQGYLAVQCSAEFGDDATLQALAGQLDAIAADTGLGIVLFRAGAAPWHDDLDVYRRLAGFMRNRAAHIYTSLNIWDICALLAKARAYLGCSLHGRIVADACGVPGVNIAPPAQAGAICKQAAYLETWHADEAAHVVAVDQVRNALAQSLGQAADRLVAARATRARLSRDSWRTLGERCLS